MSRLTAPIGCVLMPLMLQCCSDGGTAPTIREIRLKACPNYATWAAYQNEGSRTWTRIDGLSEGVTLRVTTRLKIATYYPGSDRGGLIIDFITADQPELGYNCTLGSASTTKGVSGSVLGLNAEDEAYITMTFNSNVILEENGAFTTRIIDGPVDLVATKHRLAATVVPVQEMIIRRALNPGDGATLPALDFTSAEAFAPESTAVTIAGVPPGWSADASVWFTARDGGAHGLSAATFIGEQSMVYSVPSNRSLGGDYHSLVAAARGSVAALGVVEFFRDPPRTVTFGPQLPEPAFTTVATIPNLRVRIDLATQPEYPAAIDIALGQSTPSRLPVRMRATKEYFDGTPTSWSLTMPDLSGADGYSSSWGLSSNTFWWTVEATSYPYGFSERRDARVGDVYRSAARSGSH